MENKETKIVQEEVKETTTEAVVEPKKEKIPFEDRPLSNNKFVAFWQKFAGFFTRKWHHFSAKHPKLAKLIWQFIMFFIFSNGVTIVQYLIYTFLPYAFGIEMAAKEFMWPAIELPWGVKWNIIGFDVVYNDAGEVIIGGGLGYTLSFWIGSFVAQCINFPLQRNITYKSKGNIPYQIMWYFIAWVLITFAVTAINSLWLPVAAKVLPSAVYQIVNTVVVGGISMVIFFPVFKIVFPEGEANKK